MINVGSFFPSGKASSAFRKWGGVTVAGIVAELPFAYHERLPSRKLKWVETRGTQQSGPCTKGVHLRQSRHHRGRNKGGVRNRKID